jgi:ribose transport system substrate-binding protein
MKFWKRAALASFAALMAAASLAQSASAEEKRHKIYLSMSYIGNDWQAEAANMLKAMAASKDYRDRVDLKVQVAGPNAQKQIQQINAMVQAGAEAIIVYPISPTALNEAVKAACAKGVTRSLAPTTSTSIKLKQVGPPLNGWSTSLAARARSL